MPQNAPQKKFIVGTVLTIIVSILLVSSIFIFLYLVINPVPEIAAGTTEEGIIGQAVVYFLLTGAIVSIAKPTIAVLAGLVLTALLAAILHRKVLPPRVFKLRLGFAIGSLVLTAALVSYLGVA